ncbi:MAG: hypothetical protein QXU32_00760 [Nitrososphaerales archaeon]
MSDGKKESKKAKGNPWAICTAAVGRDDKGKYERCVKSVKKRLGYEDIDPDVRKIVEALDDEENTDEVADVEPSDDKDESDATQWVIMCHGMKDGEKTTEVWGPYSSKDAAVADLRNCIRDEFGDDVLDKVEDQLDKGHVEVEGWTKVVVPLKSP